MILNYDMLAYLRVHPAFETFLASGFSEYDLEEEQHDSYFCLILIILRPI